MIKVEAENVQDLVSKLGVIFQAVLDKFPDKYQDFPDFLKDVEVIGMSAIDVHSAISMLVEFDWKKFNADLQNKVSEDKIWELVRAVDVWAGSKGLSFIKIKSPYDVMHDYEGDDKESSEWYPHLSEQDTIFLSNIFASVILMITTIWMTGGMKTKNLKKLQNCIKRTRNNLVLFLCKEKEGNI